MKIFEIWVRKSQYIVLKCPKCKHTFRRDILNLKEIKNVTCRKCEMRFPIENNSLDHDPLYNIFEGQHVLRKEIVDGKEVKEENPLKSNPSPSADFSSAAEL